MTVPGRTVKEKRGETRIKSTEKGREKEKEREKGEGEGEGKTELNSKE